MIENIRYPNITAPDQPGKIVQMQSYLYQLVEQLNFALAAIESGTNAVQVSSAKGRAGEQTEAEKQMLDSISNLKSLIIKSAHTVRSEVETLEKSLQSTYVAISDFGTFQEDITGKFEATAASLSQTIDYYATLNDKLGSVSNEFDTYVIDVEGYIRQGIIGYDGAIPIIGIAIGRDLTVTGTQETVNGKTYDVIDTSSNMSVWTPDKLAFYVNGAEIAYFSNGALYVNAVIVQERLVIGHNKWLIDHSNGLTIRWIGG